MQRTKDDINKVYLDLAWENALSTATATDSVSPATPSKKSKKAKLEIPYIDSAEHDNARIVAGIVVKTYVLAQLKAHENFSSTTMPTQSFPLMLMTLRLLTTFSLTSSS